MDPVLGLAESPALYDGAFGPSIKASPVFDLSGSGHTTDLGDLLPNNVKPSIALHEHGSPATPAARSPSTRWSPASCATESYVWKFSNRHDSPTASRRAACVHRARHL